jgi:transposase-like protein
MKIIPVGEKQKVVACFRQSLVPGIVGIARQTDLRRTTIYHWFVRFEQGDPKGQGERNSFRHYPREVRQAVVKA